MKISKTDLHNAIFFINPILVNVPTHTPELLKMVAVDILLGQDDRCNRTSYEYGMAKYYVTEALKELQATGCLVFEKG
jgi:hypothetical protein